jgi:hypothetical protein
MRILITLAAAVAIMVGLVLAIVTAGAALTAGARTAVAHTPVTTGTLAKVAFAVLWCLVFGVSAGLIGGP